MQKNIRHAMERYGELEQLKTADNFYDYEMES
jgi:hypothetical protein